MAIISDKIALDATDAQCTWFSQQCGYARFAFNHALEDYNNEPRHWKELNKRFNRVKRGIDWAGGMDQRAALFGIKNLGDAISRWKSGQNRRPKKKRRKDRQSYSTDPNTVKVEWKRIRLPKIGWVRMYQKLRHKGEITKVTLSRTAHRLKNKNLAKALSDSALGGFLALLKSKAEVLGIPVRRSPQFYASSKTCSNCGHQEKELSLSERTYHCDECGSSIDRDVNAAINLKNLAVGQAES